MSFCGDWESVRLLLSRVAAFGRLRPVQLDDTSGYVAAMQ
jgi:hypothetical protein